MAITVAGHRAEVTLNGDSLPGRNWRINFSTDELDATIYLNAGWVDWVGGLKDAQISFEFLYDLTFDWFGAVNINANPAVVPVNVIFPGSLLNDVKFYVQKDWAPNQFWHFPVATVISIDNSAEIRGLVMASVTARPKGRFKMPEAGLGNVVDAAKAAHQGVL